MEELFDWTRLKRKARDDLNNEVKAGRIEKPDVCQICGRPDDDLEGHHYSYVSHPRKAIWLCLRCHKVADALRRDDRFDWERASTIGMSV